MTNKSILIVDDDACIRLAYTKIFDATGYTLRTAESAEKALDAMQAFPAGVLFVDMDLPGMNGIELCQEVRRSWPWTILIAVTGYASLFELVKCREVGFEDYYIKPVDPKEMLGAAHDAFKKLDRWKRRPNTLPIKAGLAKR